MNALNEGAPNEAPETPSPPPPSEPVSEYAPVTGVLPSAWSILIYGTPGVGKSTLATHAPSPYFLDLENGLRRVNCAKTKRRLTTLEDVIGALRWFVKSDHKTVVIDTIDKLDELFGARAVAAYNQSNRPVKTVADIPYGRGGDLMVAEWRAFIEILDKVGDAGKNVLLTGHEQIVKFENPSDANYDFYTVNVHKKAAPFITAKMDGVFFAHFEAVVKDKDAKGKGKASTTGERVLQTSQGASWVAKNRFGLDETESMEPGVFTKIV